MRMFVEGFWRRFRKSWVIIDSIRKKLLNRYSRNWIIERKRWK
jgi:hypothetical protein